MCPSKQFASFHLHITQIKIVSLQSPNVGSLPQNHRARPELDEDAFQTLDLKITEVHGTWRIVVKMIWHFKNLEVVPKHARFHWRFRDRWTLFQNSFGFISEFWLAFQEFKGLCFADSWNLLQDAGRSVYFQLVYVPFVYKSGSVFFLLLLIFWIMYQDVSSTFIE